MCSVFLDLCGWCGMYVEIMFVVCDSEVKLFGCVVMNIRMCLILVVF